MNGYSGGIEKLVQNCSYSHPQYANTYTERLFAYVILAGVSLRPDLLYFSALLSAAPTLGSIRVRERHEIKFMSKIIVTSRRRDVTQASCYHVH